MKEILRSSVWCLFAALTMNAIFNACAQTVASPTMGGGASWLQMNVHNKNRDSRILPEWTVIITSAKPTIQQLRADRWAISFSKLP